MSGIELAQEVDVLIGPAGAWDLIADYSNDVSWRRVIEMTATPSGVVRVGTTTSEIIDVMGRVWHNDAVVTAVSHGVRFDWRTTSGATASGSRSVRPIRGGGCRIRLELNVEPHGLHRLGAPYVRRVLARLLRSDLDRLRDLLQTPGSVERPSPLTSPNQTTHTERQ